MDIAGNSLVKLKPSLRYESLPMLSPLYGGWTQRTKFYFVPYRLYIPELRKNQHLGWDEIPQLPLPIMEYSVKSTSDSIRAGVPISLAGSLLDRLHMVYGELFDGNSFNRLEYVPASESSDVVEKTFCSSLVPLLAYIDAWLYGEYNPQDKNIPVDEDVFYMSSSSDGYSREVGVSWLSYDNLKKIVPAFGYNDGLSYSGTLSGTLPTKSSNVLKFKGVDLYTGSVGSFGYLLMPNYPLFSLVRGIYGGESIPKDDVFVTKFWDTLRNTTSTVGLLPVTYKGDYFTSWFNSDGILMAERFLVHHNESILSLRRRNQDMLIQLMSVVSGNRYVDYLQYVFDTELELKDHPIMVGFDEIDFGGIDVISNAETTQGSQPIGSTSVLGATATKIRDYNSDVKPISFKTKEPGLLMVCSAIVPNVYYFQGVPRFMYNDSVWELWHPQYQKQGFMQTKRGEYYNPFVMNDVKSAVNWQLANDEDFYSSATEINHSAVSYVPLGWEHMKRYSRLSGGMKTSSFKTWSLHRDFSSLYSTFAEGNLDVPAWNTGVESFDPWIESGVDYMRSTYVDSGAFNYMFQNVSRGDQTNFIVRFSYDMSIYQPLVHTLVDKQGL